MGKWVSSHIQYFSRTRLCLNNMENGNRVSPFGFSKPIISDAAAVLSPDAHNDCYERRLIFRIHEHLKNVPTRGLVSMGRGCGRGHWCDPGSAGLGGGPSLCSWCARPVNACVSLNLLSECVKSQSSLCITPRPNLVFLLPCTKERVRAPIHLGAIRQYNAGIDAWGY